MNLRNLVNVADVRDLLRKGIPWSRLRPGRTERVRRAWAGTEAPPTSWWHVPAVQRRWNRLITGDEGLSYRDWVHRKYFAPRGGLVGLSVGCGGGHREAGWAERGGFDRIDGFDLSEPRIASARELARERGLGDVLRFHVGDVLAGPPAAASYDVIFFEMSLHHLAPVPDVLARVSRLMRPGALLVVNEYVGPRRFQWTDRQLAAINGLLAATPEGYRRRLDGSVKRKVDRPSLLRMVVTDPSEAVDAERILPALREHFEPLEWRPFGGAVLHMLLHEIGHHFLDDEDAEAARLLRMYFAAEDALLESGEVADDFLFAVCRARNETAAPAP